MGATPLTGAAERPGVPLPLVAFMLGIAAAVPNVLILAYGPQWENAMFGMAVLLWPLGSVRKLARLRPLILLVTLIALAIGGRILRYPPDSSWLVIAAQLLLSVPAAFLPGRWFAEPRR